MFERGLPFGDNTFLSFTVIIVVAMIDAIACLCCNDDLMILCAEAHVVSMEGCPVEQNQGTA